MADDCEKKAADLAFDVTKQFLTLGLAGIAFVVGLSFSTPGVISSLMLWAIVLVFGASAFSGLLFLMCGVNQLSERKTYDVYATSLRCWSIIQIILVFAGVILLVPIVARHSTEKSTAASQGVIYRLDTGKKVTIEIDEGKIKIGGETK